MRRVRSILAAGLVVLALSAATLLPAAAMADTVDSSGTVVATTTPSTPATPAMVAHPSRKAVLRYRAIARTRLAAFNADASVLRRRINRLAAVATLVEKAGGDVTNVRAELRVARTHLAISKQKAIIAAAKMRLVPYYADRKAARARAEAAFKAARTSLRTARNHKQTAGTELWKLVKQFGKRSQVPASAFA